MPAFAYTPQDGRTSLKVRQRPGGSTGLITYVVNLVNAAAGGFAFLTSATGRQAFWNHFFPLIDRFFTKGGKMVAAIPVGELSEKALDNLRSWMRVYEKAAEEKSGGLRFFFVTEFAGDSSYHIKEILIVAPGVATVFIILTANFNSRGLGLGVVDCKTARERRNIPKSAELLSAHLYQLGNDEAAAEQLEDLARFWVKASRNRWVILDTPALDDFLVAAGKRSLTSIYKYKRRTLLQMIVGRIEDDEQRQLAAQKQHAIVLAAAPAHARNEESSSEDSDAPELRVRTRPSRRLRLLKRQQRYLARVQNTHKPEWTVEEQLEIENMNAKVLAELIAEHPQWTEIISDLQKHPANKHRSKPRGPRRRRWDTPSSSGLFADDGVDGHSFEDEEDEFNGGGGDGEVDQLLASDSEGGSQASAADYSFGEEDGGTDDEDLGSDSERGPAPRRPARRCDFCLEIRDTVRHIASRLPSLTSSEANSLAYDSLATFRIAARAVDASTVSPNKMSTRSRVLK
ncbi:hypothetical protein JCM11641_002672 [Rhodosporidiobolus odoratus]